METKFEWAKYWYDLGFSVVPVHYVKPDGSCSCPLGKNCPSPGKHPAPSRWKNYQDKRADIDTLEMWFDGRFRDYNMGVVTGSISNNVFVVDVDIAEGKPGADTLDDLCMANDDLPETMQQITGSGGRHYFFKAPDGVSITTGKNVLGEGIDTRGEGGFVVVAPSNHKSGNEYIVSPHIQHIEKSPDWLREMAVMSNGYVNGEGSLQDTTVNRWGELADGREGYMVKLIIGTIRTWWAQKGVLPTFEQLIDDAWPTYEAKALARGKNLSMDNRGIELFEYKARYQLKRAKNKELRILDGVQPGSEKAERQPPSFQSSGPPYEVAHAQTEAAGPVLDTAKLPLLLSDWTLKRYAGEAPAQEWLIENILPRRIPGLIAAIGGLGKSYILLDLAMKVAGGDQNMHTEIALGGKVAHNGKVVFLGAEDSAASMHRRINSIADPTLRDRAADNLIVVPMPDAGGPIPLISAHMGAYSVSQDYLDIRKQLLDMGDVALLVIDPLQAFAHADINTDPAAAQFWWSLMSELCVAINGNILISHHMRKEGTFSIRKSMQAREAIRGTTALVDGARWAYGLWQMPEADEMVIAQRMGFEPGLGNCVMGGVVKVNDAADATTRAFIREENGLLVDRSMEVDAILEASAKLDAQQIEAIFDEVDRRWSSDEPFAAGSNTTRSFLAYLKTEYGMPPRAAKGYMQAWLDQGYLQKATHDAATKRQGIRVAKRLEGRHVY